MRRIDMPVEYALWGNPPGHDDTFGKALLVTGLTSQAAALRAKADLETRHGVTEITLQHIDGSAPTFGRDSLNV
jgi:hypothetical protein